jgi:hypothetical protein
LGGARYRRFLFADPSFTSTEARREIMAEVIRRRCAYNVGENAFRPGTGFIAHHARGADERIAYGSNPRSGGDKPAAEYRSRYSLQLVAIGGFG